MNQFFRLLFQAILASSGVYLLFLGVYFFLGRFSEGFDLAYAWRQYYEYLLFGIILYLLNAYWFKYLLTRYNYVIFTAKRLLYSLSGTLFLTLFGIFVARFILNVLVFGVEVQDFLAGERFEYYRFTFLIAIGVSILFYLFWYLKFRQENKVKEQKIIAGTASAKFNALKNQLDPHFLFNSLNVLTSLIEESPDQAQKFTTSLSKVYRYVLEQKNKDLVTVDEELNFAHTYVRLLKMRFEDSLAFEIPEKSNDPEAKIVPLSLQLLLENAVKHNIVTAAKPLHLKVVEDDGTLVVKNNLQEKQVVKKSSGVGLQNIKQRYELLTDRKVIIHKNANEFSISLPILTNRVTRKVETQASYISEKRYQKAKERVELLKGFYGNLLAYCLVIPALWWINYRTTSFLWAFFPTLGWGFGLVTHGLQAFGFNPLWGKRWEEKKMRELMEKDDF